MAAWDSVLVSSTGEAERKEEDIIKSRDCDDSEDLLHV